MKKISLILSILIALILISTYAYATVDATILARASKTTVQPGDEIEVSLYLNDLEYTNKGVDEVEVRINIDPTLIEPLTVDSIETSNGTLTIGNNTLKVEDVESASSDEVVFSSLTSDCDYKIFIDLKNPITDTNTKLFTLKCKIKDDVSYDDIDVENAMTFGVDIATQVTAQDLKNGMTADMAYKINDSLPLTIVQKTTNSDNTNNTNKNNVVSNTNKNTTSNNTNKNTTSNNTNKNTASNSTNTTNNVSNGSNKNNSTNNTNKNTVSSTNTNSNSTKINSGNSNISKNTTTANNTSNKSSTTATQSLPATGLKMFILPFIVVIAIAVFSYKKYIKYKDIK